MLTREEAITRYRDLKISENAAIAAAQAALGVSRKFQVEAADIYREYMHFLSPGSFREVDGGVEYDPPIGWTMLECIKIAVNYADEFKCTVYFKLNGIPVEVVEGDDAEEVLADYNTRKGEEVLNS